MPRSFVGMTWSSSMASPPANGDRRAADDLDAVPLVVPRSARRGLGRDLLPVGAVDDEDLVGVVVGLLGDVDVVEVGRVLVAKEQAHVAVGAVLAGAEHPGLQDEIA